MLRARERPKLIRGFYVFETPRFYQTSTDFSGGWGRDFTQSKAEFVPA